MAVDVAVVGGGVIGCSIAYHAARAGATVAVLEAGEVGQGASAAKAGMLAAQGEAHEPGPLLDLLLAGRDRHRLLGNDLAEVTGLDPGYVWAGTLRVATDEASQAALEREHAWQDAHGLATRWLDAEQLRELEPALTGQAVGGLYLPDDGQVNPPDVVTALVAGIARLGGEIHEFTHVTGFGIQGERVLGVRTTRGMVHAGRIVLAAGWASGGLLGELGFGLPVFPVKGELLVAHARPVPIRANVWDSKRLYLVPKRDGRVVIGATEQESVHDRRPTLGGVAALARAAVTLVPELAVARFDYAWGGLRPGTPSGEPLLGPVPGLERLLVATGHFRNGVLLSAITGAAVTALALDQPPPVDLDPFLPERTLLRRHSTPQQRPG